MCTIVMACLGHRRGTRRLSQHIRSVRAAREPKNRTHVREKGGSSKPDEILKIGICIHKLRTEKGIADIDAVFLRRRRPLLARLQPPFPQARSALPVECSMLLEVNVDLLIMVSHKSTRTSFQSPAAVR